MTTGAITPPQNGKEADSLSFALPPVITIETAEVLAAELKQLPFSEKTSLTLDTSQVQNITTPGLQLIISLEKTLAAQGGTFIIEGKTDLFTRAFQHTGLESFLK